MSKDLFAEVQSTTTCQRCHKPLRAGTPDAKARAIRRAAKGYCANCVITRFLLQVEPIHALIEGTGKHPGKGPEILLGGDNPQFQACLKGVMRTMLSHTQLREDEIDWIEVVGNWGMAWPAGQEPRPGNAF